MRVFGDMLSWGCPFCHQKTLQYGREDSYYFVVCQNCGAETGHKTDKPAVRKAAEFADGFTIKPTLSQDPAPVHVGSVRGKRAKVFDVIEEEQ